MTPEEQIAKMTKAIQQAMKVMGDTFGSTPGDFTRAIQVLKDSLPAPAVRPKPPASAEAPTPAEATSPAS
jgi:hypothetical protein